MDRKRCWKRRAVPLPRDIAEMDAYSPFPVDGLAEAIGFHKTRLPLLVLIGGIIGCAGGFYLQYWAAVIDYPMNIGGRPLNSWPDVYSGNF